MSKIFSKILLITISFLVFFLGITNTQKIYAGDISDCNSLGAGTTACQVYYRALTNGKIKNGESFYKIITKDKEEIRVFPDGRTTTFSADGKEITTKLADERTILSNANTNLVSELDKDGNLIRQEITGNKINTVSPELQAIITAGITACQGKAVGSSERKQCIKDFQDQAKKQTDKEHLAEVERICSDLSGAERERCIKNTLANKEALSQKWNIFMETVLTTLNVAAGVLNGTTFLGQAAFLYMVSAISSIFLMISGLLFSGALIFSIENFSGLVGAVNIAYLWTFFRDIINVCFIFLILYESIKIIIGKTSNKSKTTIVNIIVSATLINFSLFFTKVIIDAGNILAVSIYNISGGTISTIKDTIMQSLSLSSIFSFTNVTITGQMSTIFILILQITLQLILVWTFITVAILFIGRAFMLIFLLITSPVGYLQDILPQLSEQSKKWRKTLLDQVLLAPFFMLCLLIINELIINISTLVEFSKKNISLTKVIDEPYNITAIFGYIFIIFALHFSVKSTKKMSGVIAEYTTKIVGMAATAAVVGLTAGAGALTAKGASMAMRGADMVASGRSVAARGRVRGNNNLIDLGSRGIKAGARTRWWGEQAQTAGDLLGGKPFKDAAGQPTPLGIALTNAQKSVFGTVKKQTGVDLDSAFKYRENMNKEYEKRYGEIANKIGGKKEREELNVLNDISTNIKNQGESRARKEMQAKWDNVNNMPDVEDADRKEKAKAKRELQKETEDRGKQLAKAVAAEMGVDLAKHEAKKDELKITIERKTVAKNEYAASIPKKHKKMADKIRSQATYEAKDKPEDELAKMIKKLSAKDDSAGSKPKA
jgi:hypothetical protein